VVGALAADQRHGRRRWRGGVVAHWRIGQVRQLCGGG
jgi:hypothetical protein